MDLPEPLRLVANRDEADAAPDDDVVDSGGQHVFTVAVPEPGSYVVRFSLRQAWEAVPLDTQEVRVVRV
ncbi:MAG: protease inhibitor I42 family protein [Actinomycetota bacterium]|nr:protease inhibitor I42 family protein [Actinomycetota bacterium]